MNLVEDSALIADFTELRTKEEAPDDDSPRSSLGEDIVVPLDQKEKGTVKTKLDGDWSRQNPKENLSLESKTSP
jgi:hypothetical protein